MDPLVVTLQLEAAAQQRFDSERRALFPPGRTQIGAHVTLFHALPGAEFAAVRAALVAAREREVLTVAVTGVRNLGRGAAYTLACAGLAEVRAELAGAWRPWLTAQDAQPFRPHLTVQNKVDPARARVTVAALSETFAPFDVVGLGLQLWRYVGGPWEFVEAFAFKPAR